MKRKSTSYQHVQANLPSNVFWERVPALAAEQRRFFLYGEDTYHVSRAADGIVKALEPVYRESYYTWDVTIDELCAKLTTPTLFADKVAVILRNFEASKKKFRQQLDEFLRTFSFDHRLIILHEAPLLRDDLKDEALVGVSEQCFRVHFTAPTQRDITETFIPEHLNKPMEENARTLLWECTGGDLWLLAHELEKLEFYTRGRSTVTLHDVERCSSVVETRDLGQLLAHVERRDLARSMETLAVLFADGMTPVFIATVLHRHFRWAFTRQPYTPLTRFRVLKTLHDADYKLKTSGSSRYVLETAVARLCEVLGG